jgi:hypothetical protein
MTTKDIIAAIGSWNLGGVYTDENGAMNQARVLNLANSARLELARQNYLSERFVPQIMYQSFEITDVWEDDCKGGFVVSVPTIATFPAPQFNGFDGLFQECDTAQQLTEIATEQQLRSYKQHSMLRNLVRHGVFTRTGSQIKGIVNGGKKPNKLLIRAVFSEPHKVPNFNIDEDPYPFPDGFLSAMKKLLDSDEGRRFLLMTDQVSNSKTDVEDARSSANR